MSPPEPDSPRLRVQAPPRFLERLHALRSDVLKGEAWLLVGTGHLRPVARIEIVPAGP